MLGKKNLYNNMIDFIGKWKLKVNIGFDKFLQFSGYNWCQLQIGKRLTTTVNMKQIGIDVFSLKIDLCRLLNTNETIILDNTYRQVKKYKKRYRYEDNKIVVNVICENEKFNWNGRISSINEHLLIEYGWIDKGKEYIASQIYRKV